MSRPAIVKWCQQFEDCRTDLTDEEKEGRLAIMSIHRIVPNSRPAIFMCLGKLNEQLSGRPFSKMARFRQLF